MRYLKWLLQPAYLLLIIVLITLYVKREQIFPEKVLESTEAQALVDRIDSVVAHLRSSDRGEEGSEQVVGEGASAVAGPASESTVVADRAEPQVQLPSEPREPVSTARTMSVDSVPSPEAGPTEGADSIEDSSTEGGTSDNTVAQDAAPSVETVTPQENDFDTTQSAVLPETDLSLMGEEATVVPGTAMRADSQGTTSVPVPEKQRLPDHASSPSMAPLEVWRAARAAVWQGNLQGAVTNYRTLIRLQPENFDAYGEMGNVMLAQGSVGEAIEAYATASRLIRRAGHRQMAFRVAAIVATLDRPRGEALFDELAH